MSVTVNKLDYIFKKILHEARAKMNDTVEISDEEYGTIYEGNDSGNQGGNDEPIVDPVNSDEFFSKLPVYEKILSYNENNNELNTLKNYNNGELTIKLIQESIGQLINATQYNWEITFSDNTIYKQSYRTNYNLNNDNPSITINLQNLYVTSINVECRFQYSGHGEFYLNDNNYDKNNIHVNIKSGETYGIINISISSDEYLYYISNSGKYTYRGDFGMHYNYIDDNGSQYTFDSYDTIIRFDSDYNNIENDNKGSGIQIDYYLAGPYTYQYYKFNWEIQNNILYITYPYDQELNVEINNFRINNNYFSGLFNTGTSFRLRLYTNNFDWSPFTNIYGYGEKENLNGENDSGDDSGNQGGNNEEPINDNKYCDLPARLVIENVLQAPVLYNCCETSGEFCSITSDGQRFLFDDVSGHTSAINITAIMNYDTYYLGLSGFIVGHSNIPESGEDITRVICYDRACPNCYKDYNITKPLVLQTGSYAKCNSCARTYNLNTGEIVAGNEGSKLFRYRCNYYINNYSLIINNQ